MDFMQNIYFILILKNNAIVKSHENHFRVRWGPDDEQTVEIVE